MSDEEQVLGSELFFYPDPIRQAVTLQKVKINQIEVYPYKNNLLKSLMSKFALLLGKPKLMKSRHRRLWDSDIRNSFAAYLWNKPRRYSLLWDCYVNSGGKMEGKINFKMETYPQIFLDKAQKKENLSQTYSLYKLKENKLACKACLQAGFHHCRRAVMKIEKAKMKKAGAPKVF